MATSTSSLNEGEILFAGVSEVIKDEGFWLQSPLSKEALKTAEKLVIWRPKNNETWCTFAKKVVASLHNCFEREIDLKKFKKQKERMWKQYHHVRSSKLFTESWTNFLQICGCKAVPVFYQFVTNHIMKTLVKLHFPVPDRFIEETEVSLDFEERNALRYTIGYTIRSLLKKMKRSKQTEEIEKCLEELVATSDTSVDKSTEWIKAVDRGGLIHVNDSVFSVFAEMELVLRKKINENGPNQNLREVVEHMVSDEKVLFSWSIVSVNWNDEDGKLLLKMIAEQWVTVRGFSNAKSLMEEHKRRSKKSVQKSKGLRKQLPTS